jgi:hypothetical protein
MVLCLPFLGYAVIAARWPSLQIGWVNRLARRPIWPLMILAVLLLYWVLRNLPFAPFSSLAPHMPPIAN